MNIKGIAQKAKETGVVWLGGEMEFPANEGPSTAFKNAVHIAENCGYLVRWKYGHSAFSVVGGDIIGEIIVDWFDQSAKELVKIEHWTSRDEYLK
jgi:hypothetical protein